MSHKRLQKQILNLILTALVLALGYYGVNLNEPNVFLGELTSANLSAVSVTTTTIDSTDSTPTSDLSVSGEDQTIWETAVVARVVDGDTIVLTDGRKVRYIGVDTPETKHPTQPVGCFGQEASAFNETLVTGKQVRLEKDVSETDRYGRLLRYVYLDGEMVNALLVREGYARVSTYPPDVKYQTTFQDLEERARLEGNGLWGEACTDEEE